MTPKEKAIELVGKYEVTSLAGKMPLVLAKFYANIAVEEIFSFMQTDDEKHDCCSWANSTESNYWVKVKEEIKNL